MMGQTQGCGEDTGRVVPSSEVLKGEPRHPARPVSLRGFRGPPASSVWKSVALKPEQRLRRPRILELASLTIKADNQPSEGEAPTSPIGAPRQPLVPFLPSLHSSREKGSSAGVRSPYD